MQNKEINEWFGSANDLGLKALCSVVFQSAPQPWQHGQCLIAQFPCPSPHVPAPLVEGRAMWLVLVNVLWSERSCVSSEPNHLRAGVQPFSFLFPCYMHVAMCSVGDTLRQRQPRLLSHYMEKAAPESHCDPLQASIYQETLWYQVFEI